VANTLMKLLVELGVDNSELTRGLDQAEGKAEKSGKSISQKLSAVGGGMMKVGAGMTAGLTTPIVAAGFKMVSAASDLEQSIGGIESVFGDAGKTIFEFGKGAADSVGLSERSFNQLSTVSGALLQNLGFDSAGAADEMVKLAQRGSDVAATFGGPVDGVLMAVNSALKGEFEPIEQFGVKMNQAAINSEAMRLGLEGVNGELDDSAKAQAALSLFYEQTAKTQGQFASESDTLAGQQERLKANFENTASALGTQLLPIGLKIMQFVGDLVDKFNALTPEQQKTILMVLGIVAAIGPLVTIIGGLVTAFSAVAAVLSGPVLLVIAAIVAAVALLKWAWDNNFGGIQEKTAAVVEWIKTTIGNFLTTIKTWWAANGDEIKRKVMITWTLIKMLFARVFDVIKTYFDAFSAAFSGDWHTFGEKLREAWDKAWALIKEVIATLWAVIKPKIANLIANVINFFKNTDWGEVGKNIVRGIGNGLLSMIGWIGEKAYSVAKAALDAAKGFLGIDSPSKAFGELGRFAAMGFGMQFQKSMAGFQPQMAMSMSVPSASVPSASVATPAGAGSQGSGQELGVIYTLLKNLPEDLKRGNRDLIEKLGRRR